MKRLLLALMTFLALVSCADIGLRYEIEKLVAWDSSVTYRQDHYANRFDIVYRSLQDGNTGHAPEAEPLWWIVE